MPPSGEVPKQMVAEPGIDLEVYPMAAYEFVHQGLAYTVNRIYGSPKTARASRHVTGQQLCHGLRELATKQWGFLAQTVLHRWNITSTFDFGQIVFSLARQKVMSTTPQDNIEDFRDVFDFKKAFESNYHIASQECPSR
jgi:uncharacterized repeat protein (TIGR04138 family)